MNKLFTHTLLFGALLLAVLILGGCSTDANQPAPTVDANRVAFSENESNPALDADVSMDTVSDEDTSPDVVVAPEEENYCIECHTDQQALIDTAKPEEPVAKENEGEG
jgi:uncharacterized protein YcfL